MKFICDGHEYTFLPDTNQLLNNYGTVVAHVELAKDSNYDEYNYFIDELSGEVMHSEHENTALEHPISKYLVWHYVAFNQ